MSPDTRYLSPIQVTLLSSWPQLRFLTRLEKSGFDIIYNHLLEQKSLRFEPEPGRVFVLGREKSPPVDACCR